MRRFGTRPFDVSKIRKSEVGTIGETGFRLFYKIEDSFISPWHDIPIGKIDKATRFPFVCEIPRGKVEKMEVCLSEKFNPIAQDVKNGKLRMLPIEPRFNYGMFPQTFENPHKECAISGKPGDGDPIDVVDVSSRELQVGSVVPTRILGSFCFIDGGEADWKIIVSSSDSDELSTHVIKELLGFFENYKGPESGNYILENGRIFDLNQTLDILSCAAKSYLELVHSYRTNLARGGRDENEQLNLWIPGQASV